MFIIRLFITLSILLASNVLVADELRVEAEGISIKTANLPPNVYEARAIANALQSIVQSGAQSLGSFSLVENGRVLFDQISAQSNIRIAGYRVISTKDHGNKFSARLEALLLPSNTDEVPLKCRQPLGLDIALQWRGVAIKKSLPFWMQIDEQSIKRRIEAEITADGKFNIKKQNHTVPTVRSEYSLYKIDDAPIATAPPYTLAVGLDFDIKNYSNPLQRKNVLIVSAKSELIRDSQVIKSTISKTEINLDRRIVLINNMNSGRKRLENIQRDVNLVAQEAIAQTLQQLECKNFKGRIKYKNKNLQIKYGLQDGLLSTDIFSSSTAGTKQHYFTVKEMGNNKTTLHALSQDANVNSFDGLHIKLLERFE